MPIYKTRVDVGLRGLVIFIGLSLAVAAGTIFDLLGITHGTWGHPALIVIGVIVAVALVRVYGAAAHTIVWPENGDIEFVSRWGSTKVPPESIVAIRPNLQLRGRRHGLMLLRHESGRTFLNPDYEDLEGFLKRLEKENPSAKIDIGV